MTLQQPPKSVPLLIAGQQSHYRLWEPGAEPVWSCGQAVQRHAPRMCPAKTVCAWRVSQHHDRLPLRLLQNRLQGWTLQPGWDLGCRVTGFEDGGDWWITEKVLLCPMKWKNFHDKSNGVRLTAGTIALKSLFVLFFVVFIFESSSLFIFHKFYVHLGRLLLFTIIHFKVLCCLNTDWFKWCQILSCLIQTISM